jgi:hypothetical protein
VRVVWSGAHEARSSLRRHPGVYVPFQITVHNGEEDLKEEVDSIDEYREQVEPCLAGHHEDYRLTTADLLLLPRKSQIVGLCFLALNRTDFL